MGRYGEIGGDMDLVAGGLRQSGLAAHLLLSVDKTDTAAVGASVLLISRQALPRADAGAAVLHAVQRLCVLPARDVLRAGAAPEGVAPGLVLAQEPARPDRAAGQHERHGPEDADGLRGVAGGGRGQKGESRADGHQVGPRVMVTLCVLRCRSSHLPSACAVRYLLSRNRRKEVRGHAGLDLAQQSGRCDARDALRAAACLSAELHLVRRAGQRKASDGRERRRCTCKPTAHARVYGFIRGTALAVAQAASPMERATLDPDEAAEMRRIAAKVIQEGSDASTRSRRRCGPRRSRAR